MGIRIITNNVPRDVVYAYEMTNELRASFDIPPGDHNNPTDDDNRSFVRYRGDWYEIGDYTTTSPGPWNHGLSDVFREWDGYASDSFFSGTVIRYVREDGTNRDGDARVDYDRVIIGRYYAFDEYGPDEDGRLRVDEFADKYGDVFAVSTTADNRVASALTRTSYIRHDAATRAYVIERR